MARPRKPTAVLKLSGAFDKNPKRGRERENEPESTAPLGDCPGDLDEAERARWLELAGDLPWLRQGDRVALWSAAKQYAKLMRDGGSASDWSSFRGFLSDLGGMAGTRSKIVAPSKAKPKTAFGEFKSA